jgi:hypothetical protein
MDAEDDYQHWLHEWLGWDQPDPDLAVEAAADKRVRQLLASGGHGPRFADDTGAAAGQMWPRHLGPGRRVVSR